MLKIFKKIIDSFIFISQCALNLLFNIFVLLYVSNFGFRTKSKILVKYFIHAVKYRNENRTNISLLVHNKPKLNNKKRLNLKRFVLFNLFSLKKLDFGLKYKKSKMYNKYEQKIRNRNKILIKQRNRLVNMYKNFFFMNIKLNTKYFNIKKSYTLRKKFFNIISKKSKLKKKTSYKLMFFFFILKDINNCKRISVKSRSILNLKKHTKKLLNKNLYFFKKKKRISIIFKKKNLKKKIFNKKYPIYLKKKTNELVRKEVFFFFYRLVCLHKLNFSQYFIKLNMLLFFKINKTKLNKLFLNKNRKSLKNTNFNDFLFLKYNLKKQKYKYSKINNKRFYRQFISKKFLYYILKNKNLNYSLKLNLIFYLKNNYLYNKRNKISKLHLILKNEKKKQDAFRNLFFYKTSTYYLKNKIQLNYFLNLKKIKRKNHFTSVFKLYNIKSILKHLKNIKKVRKKIFYSKIIKIKNKKNMENFILLKKLLILKLRKYIIKKRISNFVFLENYIKINLFNYIFYRNLVLWFTKYKTFKFSNQSLLSFMKIYILNRIKRWSFSYYKTKKIYEKFYEKKKKKSFFNLRKFSLKFKNNIKLKNLIKYDNSFKNRNSKILKIVVLRNKFLIKSLMERYIIKKYKLMLISKKFIKYLSTRKFNFVSNFIMKKKKIISIERNIQTKGLLLFFKLYKKLCRNLYCIKKKKAKVKIKKTKYISMKKPVNFLKIYNNSFNIIKKNKLNLILKLKKYKFYLKYKFYTKYLLIFDYKINSKVNLWNIKSKSIFFKIYEEFKIFIKKYYKKIKKNDVLKKTFGKKLKIYILKNNYIFKKEYKRVKNLYESRMSKLFFVKIKNKTQLKNYISFVNKKIKKHKTQDLKIKNKKEIILKNKNYLLNLLYKRLIKINKKKISLLYSLKKKKYYLLNKKYKLKKNSKNNFIKKYHLEKINQIKIFKFFFNYSFIKKITKLVEYILDKKNIKKTIKKVFSYNKLKKKLVSLIKVKLVYKNLHFIFLNIKYKFYFFKYYKNLYLKYFFKIKEFKQYKIKKNLKKNNIYIKKKYNDIIIQNIYSKKNNNKRNLILLNFKIKKKIKLGNLNLINKKNIRFKTTDFLFKLKLKKLRNFYNLQTIDLKDQNSYYNLTSKRFNKNMFKKTFTNIQSSTPFDLFKSLFFKKASFFDSLLSKDDLTFENNLRKYFSFEFLKSYDNRFDKELPIDEFFFMDNSLQSKKVKGFFMAQPFTLPLLNILINEKTYNKRKSINVGESINKIRTLDKKLKPSNDLPTLNNKDVKPEWIFALEQSHYTTSNKKLLKSLLFSTIEKYSDYESNHHSILKQKEFISYITFLFYEYENKTNKKVDLFTLLGITSSTRGINRSVLDNFENRFKTKNSFQDSFKTNIEGEYSIRLDDKSIDNEEMFTSFADKDEPLDFYNDMDVFQNMGNNAVFHQKNQNIENIPYKITNFFKNRKYRKQNEKEFEERIKQYYSSKIIKGSILTDFDSFLVQEHIRKKFFFFELKILGFSFIYKILFYIYYYCVVAIIKYFVAFFKIKNILDVSEKNKMKDDEKLLWINLLNNLNNMLQECYLNKTSFEDLKQKNYKYHKLVLELLLKGKNFNFQIEKIRALELSLITNFSFINLQYDFDKKFFFEELLSIFNIEETDWFLMKDSLFYKKSSKDFKELTSKYPYIERSLDVMLDKNKYLIELHNKRKKNEFKFTNKNQEKTLNQNMLKNPKIFIKNADESFSNLYDVFSNSVYKKMKSFRFSKKDKIKKKNKYRITMEKRRKKRTFIKLKDNNINKKHINIIKKKYKMKQSPRMKILLNLLDFFLKKKYNLHIKKKSTKNLIKLIKTLKIYKKKEKNRFYLRKKNLMKKILKEKETTKNRISLFKKVEKFKEINYENDVYVNDLIAFRLKQRSLKEIFRKKLDLKFKNAYLLNFEYKFKFISSSYDSTENMKNYNEHYEMLIDLLMHYRKKYRKTIYLKNLSNHFLLKLSLKYFEKTTKINFKQNIKLKRSRNIKLYFKYVSAKLYRRRLFFNLIKKKKNEIEKRFYRLKIKNKWSRSYLFLDKDVAKQIVLNKMRKKHQLLNKYYRKNFFKELETNNHQKSFIIKLLKISRSKFQSKFHDSNFVNELLFNKYLSTNNEDNEDINNIFKLNSRYKYRLSFNSNVFEYNFITLNKNKNEEDSDFPEEKLHKYYNLKNGFYFFENKYNNKRIKRMIFRNYYIKKIMYKNKFFDYRQINRNKYILKKIEKVKYRIHHILKRQKKSIIHSLKKNSNIKIYFIRKYFKYTFSLLVKYFTQLVFKKFTIKKNFKNIRYKIEKYKFISNKINKYNKVIISKLNLKKNSLKFSLKKKLQKIVCIFLHKKKFIQLLSTNLKNKVFSKINKIHKNQLKFNNKFYNFYLRKERKYLKKILSKMPSKLLNKDQHYQSKHFNIEVSYYNKIRSIIKRNVIIKNQHNYSWNSLTQESKNINYLIKTRSLNYNELYQNLFMSKVNDNIFVSKNFFEFSLPFVKTQEKYIVNNILKKVDNLYYKIWEKFELKFKKTNSKEKETFDSNLNIELEKNLQIRSELLFLQWFIKLNNTVKNLDKYLHYSLITLIFIFSWFFLDLNLKNCLIFTILLNNIMFPFYYFFFHFMFRIIKVGIKVYYFRYLQKEKIKYNMHSIGFHKNKIKRLSVSFFTISMSFFYCEKHYIRLLLLIFIQMCLLLKVFVINLIFIKLYILTLILVFLFIYFFNLKDSKNLYVKIIEFLLKILIFEIPWFLFYWIFTATSLFSKYFKFRKIENSYIYSKGKFYKFIEKMIQMFLINKTIIDLFTLENTEVDFNFLENFFKLNDMAFEKKIYKKHLKYLKKN